MIGQWCMIDENKFCQEENCQACQVNYFSEGWAEYLPAWDEMDTLELTIVEVQEH